MGIKITSEIEIERTTNLIPRGMGQTGPWNHSIKLSKKIRNEIQGIVESQKLGQAQKIIKRGKSTSHSKKSRKKLKNKLKMFYRKEVEKKKILKALPTLN